MRMLLVVLALAVLPAVAPAQEAKPAAAAAPSAYLDYTAGGFGFKIKLPATGTINDPNSAGWTQNPQVAFIWLGDGSEPVRKILGRVDPYGMKVDVDGFRTFCDELLDNWKANPNAELLTENKPYQAYGLVWNIIEAAKKGPSGEREAYYSVFSTFSGESIYTFAFYYKHPPNEATQKFGAPVLQGFKPLAAQAGS
jgi:hypothetical protein